MKIMNDLNELRKRLEIFEQLDRYFKKLIPDNFIEIKVDSLIDKEELAKCGYFEKNPDYILANGSINRNCMEHVMTNREVMASDIDNETISFLQPAGCLNIYPLFKNRTDIENTCITTRAKVFRKENIYTEGIRLKEFTQRETVFIGDKEYVCYMLNKFESNILEFAKTINKESKSEIAYDNFYNVSQNRLAKKYQLINKTKKEIVIPINGNNVACSSINFHNVNFSKAFNFSCDNRIVTGCVGFGIERWCTALEANDYDISIIMD